MVILPNNILQTNKLSSNNTNPKNKKLIITLMQIVIYELWLSRNKLNFEGIQLIQQTIMNNTTTHNTQSTLQTTKTKLHTKPI